MVESDRNCGGGERVRSNSVGVDEAAISEDRRPGSASFDDVVDIRRGCFSALTSIVGIHLCSTSPRHSVVVAVSRSTDEVDGGTSLWRRTPVDVSSTTAVAAVEIDSVASSLLAHRDSSAYDDDDARDDKLRTSSRSDVVVVVGGFTGRCGATTSTLRCLERGGFSGSSVIVGNKTACWPNNTKCAK